MSSTSTLTTAMPHTRPVRAFSPSSSTPTSPQSPKSPSHTPRRPSISNTMHWLSRTATSGSSTQQPYSPSKPIKISEPKRVRTIDSISTPRSGTLGAGATIVRTPDEALRETGVRLSPELSDKSSSSSSSRLSLDKNDSKKKRPSTPALALARQSDVQSTLMNEPISPPTSPPLPPIPLAADADDDTMVSESESPTSGSKTPPRPNRAPPPPPLVQSHSRRSSMKGRTISSADDAPTVPPLPPHIIASTQPPPFHALLVIEPPSVIMDPSKIIVTLETCTETHKTTLSTIYSRPSHLSTYFSNLFKHSDKHSIASIYSAESDDLAMYNRHLTSQGLLPPSINVHIFLDRPSTPYAHILSYLRSPLVEGQAEVLPRALQLNAPMSAQARLENLIEVRDEATFLNLDGLHKLCSDEIRLRYGPRLHHTRGNSAGSGNSIHSLHASIYSLHTLLERVETDLEANNIAPSSSEITAPSNASKKPSSPQETSFPSRSPPTPQSWDGPRLEQRSQSRQSQNRRSQTPPAGWI